MVTNASGNDCTVKKQGRGQQWECGLAVTGKKVEVKCPGMGLSHQSRKDK